MQSTTQDLTQMFGYEVIDDAGNKIGKVDNIWVDDATNDLEFVGVKTGWLMGKTHIIPTANAQIGDGTITVPYAQDLIKDAPSFGGDEELSNDQEAGVYSHYGIQRSESASPTGLPGGQSGTEYAGRDTTSTDYANSTDYTNTTGGERTTGFATVGDNAEQTGVVLSEEQLQVGKQQVEAGRVRLRKVVRTEHEEVPVELRREEIQIERVSASDSTVPGDAFSEQQVEIPVMREEAVVGKEAHVTGEVQVNKNVQTETRTVGGDIRREDVEIEGGEEAGLTGEADNFATRTRDSEFKR